MSIDSRCIHKVQVDPKKYVGGGHSMCRSAIKPLNESQPKKGATISQLCQVPDISSKTAHAISEKYPSLQALLSTFAGMDDQQKLKILKEIQVKDSKGKGRRISEKVVKNIIEYML